MSFEPQKKQIFVHIILKDPNILIFNELSYFSSSLFTIRPAIEMLEENPNVCSYDVLIDGRPADFKKTKKAHNIYKYAKEAVRKQGAEIVLFQLEKNTDEVQWELLRILRKGYEAMYFFTNEEKVYVL